MVQMRTRKITFESNWPLHIVPFQPKMKNLRIVISPIFQNGTKGKILSEIKPPLKANISEKTFNSHLDFYHSFTKSFKNVKKKLMKFPNSKHRPYNLGKDKYCVGIITLLWREVDNLLLILEGNGSARKVIIAEDILWVKVLFVLALCHLCFFKR